MGLLLLRIYMYEENFHKFNADVVESSYTINNEWVKELLKLFIYLLNENK